ncbi:MAG TPA: ABC transporter ATP-binding protein [Bryobacteraceae bacterium]|nr:ABC transporter ATP-binding protein [Bryobacteraceae bacterium]
MNAVEFQGVSKTYAIYESPGDRLRELLSFNRLRRHRDFQALQDVTFEVKRGETFCIVGENGSGKSTTLQMVAGILQPTAGTVTVNGRVSALLELGAGFNPEFSGRDNVYLNGSIMGLTTRQVDQRYNDIAAFAEIGDFIDQPVKTYSSGMVVRLAFAVAINVDPEILLVDEALAVGDIYFRQRCMRKVHELRARGITILFVSHATADVKAVGDRVLWLDKGRLVEVGAPDRVIARYLAAMVQKDTRYLHRQDRHDDERAAGERVCAPEVVETIPNIDHRYGDGRARVIGIAILSEQGEPLHQLDPASRIVVRISVRAQEHVGAPNVGFMLRNQLGVDFSGTNTIREGHRLEPMQAGDTYTVDFHLDLPELYPSSFSFSPAVADGDLTTYQMCDWIDNAIVVQMARSANEVYGYLHMPCRVEVNARLVADEAAPAVEKQLG